MKNFVLENPTKIIFGRETIGQIGPEARAFGTTALLVYGRGSLKASWPVGASSTARFQPGSRRGRRSHKR